MPETSLDLAVASLERLRTLVCGIRLPVTGSGLRVTLSAGLSSSDENTRSLDELIARADAALYTAKNDGRDAIRVADGNEQNWSTGVRRALRLTTI